MTLDELLQTVPAEVKAAIEQIEHKAGTSDADWQFIKAAGELLAAAKAASVVPVKWKSVERFFKPFLSDVGNKWGIEYWFDTKEQRDKFGKWIKERGEG